MKPKVKSFSEQYIEEFKKYKKKGIYDFPEIVEFFGLKLGPSEAGKILRASLRQVRFRELKDRVDQLKEDLKDLNPFQQLKALEDILNKQK